MASKVIVLVSDRDDPKHGEISVLGDGRKAERLVETLLEAGFDRERIRVFTGAELDLQVTQRPVVALVNDGVKGEGPEAEASPQEEADAEPEEVTREAEEEEEQAPVTAFTRNGVRFSSLFRSA